MSLRASAVRRRPWERSTGPRTETGKSHSKLNALNHGQYSLARRAERRKINESIQQLLGGDGALPESATAREREAWTIRLAKELEVGIANLMARITEQRN